MPKIEYASTGPGKFETSGTVGEYLYGLVLDGWASESTDDGNGYSADLILFDDGDPLVIVQDGEQRTYRAAVVEENSQGFVSTSEFDTVAAARAYFEACEEYCDQFHTDDEY